MMIDVDVDADEEAPPSYMHLAADPEAIHLALHLAKKRAKMNPSLADEFEGAALFGLAYAAKTFDPGMGTKFMTYAYQRIWWSIIDCEQDWRPRGFRGPSEREGTPQVTSLDRVMVGFGHYEKAGTWSRTATYGARLESDDEPVGSGIEYQDELERFCRLLPPNHAKVFRSLYGHADLIRMTDVGKALGCSLSRTWDIHKQAIEMIRDALDDAARAGTEPPAAPPAPIQTTSRFRGVYLGRISKRDRCARWRAHIYEHGRMRPIGTFKTDEEAARAYDREAIRLGRPVEMLNFPEEADRATQVKEAS